MSKRPPNRLRTQLIDAAETVIDRHFNEATPDWWPDTRQWAEEIADASLDVIGGPVDPGRQPCGCRSAYIHDHGCTKFASLDGRAVVAQFESLADELDGNVNWREWRVGRRIRHIADLARAELDRSPLLRRQPTPTDSSEETNR